MSFKGQDPRGVLNEATPAHAHTRDCQECYEEGHRDGVASTLSPPVAGALEGLLKHLVERRQGNGMSCLNYAPKDGNEYGYGSCKWCGWAESEHVIDRLWVAFVRQQVPAWRHPSAPIAKDSDGTQAGEQPVPPGVENINERLDLPPSGAQKEPT